MNKKFFFSFLFLILIISSVNAFYASNAQYEIRGNIAQGGNSATSPNYNLRFFIPEQPCGRASNAQYDLCLCYYLEATIPPTQPLNVSLAANPNTGNDPLNTTLTASITGGTSPYTYEWDYTSNGSIDDTTSSTPSLTDTKNRTYTPAGNYTATVKVKDSSVPQQNAQAQATIIVNPLIPVNRPPTVEADGPYAGSTGQNIVLNNVTASDPDGDPLTYNWFLNPSNDCTTSNETTLNNFTVNCSTAGNRDAIIVVQDGKGGVADDTAIVNVTASASNPPNAVCTVSPLSGTPNVTLFTANASGSTDDTTPFNQLQFCFDWKGDGMCDKPFNNDEIQDQTYSSAGTYNVLVQVKDNDNLISFASCGTVNVGAVAPSSNLLWLQKLTAVPMKAKIGEQIKFTATVRDLNTNDANAKVRFYFTNEWGNKIAGAPEFITPEQEIEGKKTKEFVYNYTVNAPLQVKTNYFINAVAEAQPAGTEDADQLFDNSRRKIFEVIEIRPVYAPELSEAIIPAILLIITIILLRK